MRLNWTHSWSSGLLRRLPCWLHIKRDNTVLDECTNILIATSLHWYPVACSSHTQLMHAPHLAFQQQSGQDDVIVSGVSSIWRWCSWMGSKSIRCLLPTAQTCTAAHVLANVANSIDANALDCGDLDWNVPNSCTLSCAVGYTPSTNPISCTATDTYTVVTCQGASSPLRYVHRC